jgi:hypothetical protein
MAQITLNSTGVASNGSLVLQSNGTTTAVTIDASQRAAFVAGTVALPAITTTGDTNTGIYFPAADTIAFTDGGVESMRIDSSGNVGIGGTTPASNPKLSMYGGIRFLSNETAAATYTGIGSIATDMVSISTVGTEKVRVDNNGNVLVTSAAGLGYGTGAGGTVTQATNKSTGVTLNKPTGQITMNNAALGSGANVSFTVSNSLVTSTDTIILASVTGSATYTAILQSLSAGQFVVRVTNVSGGSLSDALPINFAIIKGATL